MATSHGERKACSVSSVSTVAISLHQVGAQVDLRDPQWCQVFQLPSWGAG